MPPPPPSQDDLRRKRQAEKDRLTAVSTEAFDECKRRGYFKKDANEVGDDGETPLLTAIKNGNAEGMDLLIKAGADTEKRDKRSFTAFLVACNKGHVSSMQKLIQLRGAGITQEKDSRGSSPRWIAAEGGGVEAVRFLGEKEGNWAYSEINQKGQTPLFAAAKGGQAKVVDFLVIKCGQAMLTTPDNDGMTPLHAAAANGHLGVIRTMMTITQSQILDDDAERDKFALDYAKKGKHKDVVEYLKSEGALSKGSSACTLL